MCTIKYGMMMNEKAKEKAGKERKINHMF